MSREGAPLRYATGTFGGTMSRKGAPLRYATGTFGGTIQRLEGQFPDEVFFLMSIAWQRIDPATADPGETRWQRIIGATKWQP
jgi:hypothetical protein